MVFSRLDSDVSYYHGSVIQLLLCLYMILYIFTRVVVVVESFINISFLPDTVYEMPHS